MSNTLPQRPPCLTPLRAPDVGNTAAPAVTYAEQALGVEHIAPAPTATYANGDVPVQNKIKNSVKVMDRRKHSPLPRNRRKSMNWLAV